MRKPHHEGREEVQSETLYRGKEPFLDKTMADELESFNTCDYF